MPPHKSRKGSVQDDGVVGDHHAGHGACGEGAIPRRPLQPSPPSGQTYCCVPMGCSRLLDDPISKEEHGDAVKVACNNEACTEGTWMHADCFQLWEDHVLSYLRSCGRARSWSERQRLQNLWTKKGYDLAYKACDCKCGRGHLRKDLDFFPPKPSGAAGGKKHKKKNERPVVMLNKAAGGPNYRSLGQSPPNQQPGRLIHDGGNNNRPQLRVRTSSFSSTGSGSASPPSSAGTPPHTPGSGGASFKKSQFDFFVDPNHAAAGNIFRRRTDFSVFNVLPRHQQNPYHIKMEDEGPHGNDETRCFVLTNLSTHHVTSVGCVICQNNMPVFDKYPLIDGTFFLSPQRYNSDLMVLSDHRMLYMNALCMKCLDGSRQLQCRACRSPWQGSAFVIGSMYAYDIFAAMPCCAQRLSCKHCRGVILDPSCAFQFFSEYSKPIQCPHCRVEDFHFIKPLEDVFTAKPRIGGLRNF